MTSEQRAEYIQQFENIYKNCLFRYRRISDKPLDEEAALKNNFIRFSRPFDFNDPYDNLIYADISTILSHIYANLEAGMGNYLKGLKRRDSFAAFLGDNNWCGKHREEYTEGNIL